MTTRFSLAELADMLHVPVAQVRAAVEDLHKSGALTAESFVYGDRNWRIAPSDIKRVQAWIEQVAASVQVQSIERRRVKRKQVVRTETDPSG